MKIKFESFKNGIYVYRLGGSHTECIAKMSFLKEDYPFYLFSVNLRDVSYCPLLQSYMKNERNELIFENSSGQRIHDDGLFMGVYEENNAIYARIRDCRC